MTLQMCGLLDGDPGRADVLVKPIVKTFMSSSLVAPIETAQLDEVQVERLDLGQHAVEGGPIQNTSQQRVFTVQQGHHRLKGRKGGRAKVARDPNRVQTRSLVHLSNGQDSHGESASPGSGDGALRSQFDGSPAMSNSVAAVKRRSPSERQCRACAAIGLDGVGPGT